MWKMENWHPTYASEINWLAAMMLSMNTVHFVKSVMTALVSGLKQLIQKAFS